VEKPSGPQTLTLETDVAIDDRCEMAKRAYNSARRGKLAYQALVLALAAVLALAVVWAIVSFSDDLQARGFLGLVGGVGALLVGGFFGALARDAARDEQAMWERVEKHCGGG
jgi:polyferredoxin